jgi:hypothetical protein
MSSTSEPSADAAADRAALLRQLQISPSQAPIVISGPGQLLRDPGNAESSGRPPPSETGDSGTADT